MHDRIDSTARPTIFQPIDWDDQQVYQAFFQAASGAAVYANSWTYITQACRGLGLGWKYLDGDRLISVGRHNGHFVVVNPLGIADNRLGTVLATLRELSSRPVFIKKASNDHAAALTELGCVRAHPEGYRWDEEAYADDDTFPELIVDLDVSLGYARRPAEWFEQYRVVRNGAGVANSASTRASYRQFRRYVLKGAAAPTPCEVMPYRPNLLQAIERWIGDYFGSERPEAPRVYDNLLASLRRGIRENSEFCFVVGVPDSAEILGVIFAERVDACSAAVYARLIRRAYPGLPEYAMAQALGRLREAGIRRVNLGGSENSGLHIFKKKLAPIEERTLPLLVFGYRGGS
jgi:hypothetical protein